MRIAILGDTHFIADNDPFRREQENRAFFKDAWPSFKRLAKVIGRASPDLVILVGDLLDWYSDENRDWGLECMAELEPWLMTPGNHDFATIIRGPDGQEKIQSSESKPWIEPRWPAAGVELHNRRIEAEGYQLLLLDSATSTVREGSEAWLDEVLSDGRPTLLFTHVPVSCPETIDYILSVDPKRDMSKYVQAGSPRLFEDHLKGRVERIFTGHLHFGGEVHVDGTIMHMLPQGIQRLRHKTPATAMLLDIDGEKLELRTLCGSPD